MYVAKSSDCTGPVYYMFWVTEAASGDLQPNS